MTRIALALLVLVLLAAGCGRGGSGGGATTGGGDLSGRIEVDGSSTVAPLLTVAAERFRSEAGDVQVTVGVSGTGGGFERFCAGETDLSNASRPIKEEEAKLCADQGVEYAELRVATDALTVVVNRDNDWAQCLTVAQLKKIWEPGSKVRSWRDLDASFPDTRLTLFGPGTDSGTFDYFTGVVVGEEGASRSDYQASENDNVLVQGVSGEAGGLGYFGFSYYEQNQGKLKALAIDGGSGCVPPSVETAQDGSYRPLSRPLLLYVKRSAFARPEVEAFVRFILDSAEPLAEAAQFVPLTEEQLAEANTTLDRLG